MPKKMYLEAGQVVGTHGVRGELRVQPWCDSPELFATLRKLYWDKEGKQAVRVNSRAHKNIALVKIEGIETVQEASALRDKILYLHRDDLKLEAGRYFIDDLIGLKILDDQTGEEYGVLTDVSATGANDVYHMRCPNGKEILIPAIPLVVQNVDIDGGTVTIHPMKGLLDDED